MAMAVVESKEDSVADNKSTDEDIPQEFMCPITREVMRNPVITVVGHSYEREAIEEWLLKHNSDPLTGMQLSSKMLVPNHTLRKQIESYVVKYGIKIKSSVTSFHPLLKLLREHTEVMRCFYASSNILHRLSDDWLEKHKEWQSWIKNYLKSLKKFTQQMQETRANMLKHLLWLRGLAKAYANKELALYLEKDELKLQTTQSKGEEVKASDDDIAIQHILPRFIALKTSLRCVAGAQELNLTPTQQMLKLLEAIIEKSDITGSNFDFEEEAVAFSALLGAMVGGNAGGTTGATIGSAGGPVGTVAGATIGFYLGVLVGATPPMAYAAYREHSKAHISSDLEIINLAHLGLSRYCCHVSQELKELVKYNDLLSEQMSTWLAHTTLESLALELWLNPLELLISLLQEPLL
ncbi:hypothetical protein RFI_31760 [Reticulomyxa filosa]|uniref:U-box domain-containing protein n=1 Tax=Reticulomyxa filosa TaxID=46433 RepID=X6LW77_RETFI|nr:hypothetical protein RFI_31760 [Reticulomyxa filosa]|eukprot:ETO05636.1 hypothetical protein RFI_31760 [Reticulomyxa filosa]